MVHISFEVEFCIPDCPFSQLDSEKNIWFCNRLASGPEMGEWVIIPNNLRAEPLKDCPFKENKK